MEKVRLIETLEAMKKDAERKRLSAREKGLREVAIGKAFEISTFNIVIAMLERNEFSETIRAEYIKEGEKDED